MSGTGLTIAPRGELDLLSLGALVHRLDPGVIPFRKATQCQIHVSGGEFNVAANLADCFGMRTGIATAMVDYPIGDLIAERVRAMGVRAFYKRFAHDGVRGPNMATVYSDQGFGVRPPVVFYNRSNEAAAQLRPGDFDWPAIFAGGVRWFHSGGIFAALSPTTPEVIVEGMRADKAAGAVISFDLNFRAKLWQVAGGLAGAQATLRRIVEHVDVLVGNEGAGAEGTGCGVARQARCHGFYRHDGPGRPGAAEHQDRGHDAESCAFDQPAFVERGGLDRRKDLSGADLRVGCAGPGGRRRWF